MNTVALITFLGIIVSISAQNVPPKIIAGKSYRIISSVNHMVLDVRNRQVFNWAPVISFPWKISGTANQVWIAQEISQNVFTFASSLKPKFVLHRSITKTELVYVYEYLGQLNQQWTLEPIHPGAFTFYIQSMHDNKVIQLDKNGETVSMQNKTETNRKQHWIIGE